MVYLWSDYNNKTLYHLTKKEEKTNIEQIHHHLSKSQISKLVLEFDILLPPGERKAMLPYVKFRT